MGIEPVNNYYQATTYFTAYNHILLYFEGDTLNKNQQHTNKQSYVRNLWLS